MSYSFEEYDAFLASFGNSNPHLQQQQQIINNNNNKSIQQALSQNSNRISQNQQMLSNPSLSNSMSTDDDLGFNTFYTFNDENENAQFLLSPDYTSNSSNSPIDFQLQNNDINGAQYNEFEFQPQGSFDVNNNGSYLKKESVSSDSNVSSQLGSPAATLTNDSNNDHNNTHRVKLADVKGHSQASISKKPCKKEKSSHNMIEKRYRTNINDKIKGLRDSVPALRVLVDSGDDEFDDQLDGLQPAKKLNKATILAKATEYIKHLEAKNDSLRREVDELRSRIYENQTGSITPGTSVSSYSSNSSSASQNQKSNYANKILLGGLACMVGSGLNDDLNNGDAKSLFALPVFSFDHSGFQVLSKPFLILIKIFLIVGVVLSIIFPSLLYPSDSKKKPGVQSTTRSIDDVRNLRTSSIWSTFQLKRGHSNNDYVKSAIYRSVLLKVQNHNANIIVKFLTDVYIDKLWTYIKAIKLNSELNDYHYIRALLSLDNSETINNEDHIKKFINFDFTSSIVGESKEQFVSPDFSIVSIFYKLINETTTNTMLRKFMLLSVSSNAPISEINKELSSEIDDINVELKTLFNTTDSQIAKYKETLESWDVSSVKTDDLLVLYSSIIQNLIFDKKDTNQAKRWLKKIDVDSIKDFQLLGFTALYAIITAMIQCKETYQDDKEIIFKIEEISGILRIWLGNSSGSILNFKKRSQLIDYFVNVNLKINGLEYINDDLRVVPNLTVA